MTCHRLRATARAPPTRGLLTPQAAGAPDPRRPALAAARRGPASGGPRRAARALDPRGGTLGGDI
eukprot:501245-Pyramimonas_sp.AAC.1